VVVSNSPISVARRPAQPRANAPRLAAVQVWPAALHSTTLECCFGGGSGGTTIVTIIITIHTILATGSSSTLRTD
jgi:hypothetical protein